MKKVIIVNYYLDLRIKHLNSNLKSLFANDDEPWKRRNLFTMNVKFSSLANCVTLGGVFHIPER